VRPIERVAAEMLDLRYADFLYIDTAPADAMLPTGAQICKSLSTPPKVWFSPVKNLVVAAFVSPT